MWKINILISKELLFHTRDSVESIAEFILAGPESLECPDFKVIELEDQMAVTLTKASAHMVNEAVSNFENFRFAYPNEKERYYVNLEIGKNVTHHQGDTHKREEV